MQLILYMILFENILKGVTDRSFLEERNPYFTIYPHDKDSLLH